MQKQTLARRTAVLAGALVTALAPAAAAQAAPKRAALRGATPHWTKGAKSEGAATGPVSVRVYLAPRGGVDALKAAVTAVSTPGSASYGHFLTPAQFRRSWAPTDANASAVKAWLRSAGLTVDGVEASNRYVAASGTPAEAGKAFGTALKRYQHRGQTVRAPGDAVTVPESVKGGVIAVSGLDSTQHAARSRRIKAPDAFVNGRPCSRSYGQLQAKYQADFQTPLPKFNGQYRNYAVCGYTPSQYRSGYLGSTTPKRDGSGITVAIVDAFAAPTIRQDANTYATRHGDPAFAGSQFSQNNAKKFALHPNLCQTPDDWAGEETLDVEAVHGMAPGANVRYYGAKSCLDPDLNAALARIVDENKASMVSNSYGDLESVQSSDSVAAFEQVVLQGEMQGIGFFFSSGDDGDELAATGEIQADYPASDPYVTAVGGTSDAIDANGSLAFQTGWGTNKYHLSDDGKSWVPEGFLYGAGGGYSSLFNRPAYQQGVVPTGSDPGSRAVPDIGLDGDPTTGMLVGETQAFPDGDRYGEYRIGGTSLASPLMAGVQADAEQGLGHRLGFANPAIYKQAKNAPQRFRDVVPTHPGDGNVRSDYANGLDATDGILYSVRTFGTDSSLFTAKGWDDVTGVGSPTLKYINNQK